MIPAVMPARRGQTTNDIVRAAAKYFGPFIKRGATFLARGDYQLAQDLEQEALILLWELDPTRFESTDEGYVKNALWKDMLRARRDERNKAHELIGVDFLDEDHGDPDGWDE